MWEPPADDVELPPGEEPLVLVAPSTAQDPDHTMLRAALRGLAGAAVRVLATWNRRLPPRPLPVPANARVVDWVSYSRTMPRCDAVVCHAGHGTLARALSSGCAVVACPAVGDMNENAARLDWAGAGVRLPRRFVAPRPLRLAVERALAEPSIRARARELGALGTHARCRGARRGAHRAPRRPSRRRSARGIIGGVQDAVAAYCAASQANDMDALAATFAADVQLPSPLSGQLRFRGRDDVRFLLGCVYDTISHVRWDPPIGEGSTRAGRRRSQGRRRCASTTPWSSSSTRGLISDIRPHLRPWLATTSSPCSSGPRWRGGRGWCGGRCGRVRAHGRGARWAR